MKLTLSLFAPHGLTGAGFGIANVRRFVGARNPAEVVIRALVAIDGPGG